MDFNKIVKEEMDKIVKEADKNSPKIAKELESMRKKFVPELKELAQGHAFVGKATSKRVELQMVSKVIDIPMNELMLYFLNMMKNTHDQSVKQHVTYQLGMVSFYLKETD